MKTTTRFLNKPRTKNQEPFDSAQGRPGTRHSFHSGLRFQVSSFIFLLLGLAIPALAVDTKVWDFTNANAYVIPPQYQKVLELKDGVARLILQPTELFDTTFADYLVAGSSYDRLGIGSDVALMLTQATPTTYNHPGRFTSRVIDGGPGVIWQMMHIKASNRLFDNTTAELSTASRSGIVGLWHMNTDWSDSTPYAHHGVAVPSGGYPVFATAAKFGSHSALFNSAGAYAYADGFLGLTNTMSLALWVNCLSSGGTFGMPLVLANGASSLCVLRLGGTYSGVETPFQSIGLMNYVTGRRACTVENQFGQPSDLNSWHYIVVTYDALATVHTKVYKDAVALQMSSDGINTTLSAQNKLFWGIRADLWVDSAYYGNMDEVAIFNRVLSQDEIVRLFDEGSSVRARIKSGNTPSLAGDFVGPDGTTNSYYVGVHEVLTSSGNFTNAHRYIQYQLDLLSDASGQKTPYIESVGFFGSRGLKLDNTMLDFRGGAYNLNVTNAPMRSATPYVGLSKESNGGYVTNGIFVSRVFDVSNACTWQRMDWTTGEQMTNTVNGMLALYRLNGSWSDESTAPGDYSGTAVNGGWSTVPKLGAQCALFDNGVSSSHVNGFGFSNIQSVAFWINDENPTDGIMQFGGGQYLAVENHTIVAQGFADNPPTISVNGRMGSRRLVSGWNHVAVSWRVPIAASAMDVGVANGDYMGGMLDEMAVYDRQFTTAEIAIHYAASRPTVAGNVRLQLRAADDTNTLAATAWYTASPFAQPPSPLFALSGRYMQYRVVLEGDGNSTPAFGSVTVQGDIAGTTVYAKDWIHSEVVQGTFTADRPRWYGDEMTLIELSSTEPANMFGPEEANIGGIWHMDESSWGTVLDESQARNGSAHNGASPTRQAKLGTYCGYFDGGNDYVGLAFVPELINSNVTVALWFNSVATNRCALLSTYGEAASGSHVTLELNGDGNSEVPGKVAFVVDDGPSDTKSAVSFLSGLNDGQWHHVAGVRQGPHLYVYVDGDQVGNTFLGTGYGPISQATPLVAKYGTNNIYFKGLIDEVAVWYRALSDAEIGEKAAAGYGAATMGTYVSDVIDASRPAIWETISWLTDGPYGLPLSSSDSDLVGLWRMEGNANDATADPENGTLNGGASFLSAGRIGSCLSLDGDNDWVDITDDPDLEPALFTVELWAKLGDLPDRVVFDKSNGSTTGYRIGTDSNGCPYFTVGTLTAKNTVLALRPGAWAHLLGMYDGTNVSLCVNGEMRARVSGGAQTVNSGDARIGADASGNGDVGGMVDEVAIFKKVLKPEQVVDHYRAGAVTMKFQGRSANDPVAILTNVFLGPNRTTNTFFVNSVGENMQIGIPLGRYFQYKAYLGTENHLLTPRLQGIQVDGSSYATTDPTVEVATGYGLSFPGALTVYSHVMATNNDSSVRYQISGDNGSTWYYWDALSNAWVDVTLYGGGYSRANSRGEINSYIGNFYKQLYEKTGGIFKFRAFLHSLGNDQVAIDSVSLTHSSGRIVLTFPNGEEKDSKALVVGTPYTITWDSDGAVSGNLSIDLVAGTNVVANLASGAPDSGSFTRVLSEQEGTNYFIRIRDMDAPTTIWDWTDSNFWLVQQFHLTRPDGGEWMYVGRRNPITWDSPKWGAANFEGFVDVWFSEDDGSSWFKIGYTTNSSGTNVFNWLASSNDSRLVSSTARIGVTPENTVDPGTARDSGGFGDMSDSAFTMAGVVVTYPFAGEPIQMGNLVSVEWKAAGVGPDGVTIEFTTDAGVTWTNITTNATCVPGANAYVCRLEASSPTEDAKLRITSNHDPANVWGESAVFTLADITIISPVGGSEAERDQWQIGTTNFITWKSAGAGNDVKIQYSASGRTNWITISPSYMNTNSSGGVIITNYSPPWIVAGPPSSNAFVKVGSTTRTNLYAEAGPFDISGVQIIQPNGAEVWEFTGTNRVNWIHRAAGPSLGIDVLYVSEPTTNSYEFLTNGSMNPLIPATYRDLSPYVLRRPTTVAKLRIRANSPPSGIPMVDFSDATFTIRGLLTTYPTNNSVYTLGTTVPGGLQWYSAAAGANVAQVYYATNGIDFNDLIWNGSLNYFVNQDADPSFNQKDWTISRRLMPSVNARVKVVVAGYSSLSPFFKIRGIRMMRPAEGSVFDIGASEGLNWAVANLSTAPGARMSNSLSTAGTAGPYMQAGLPTDFAVANKVTTWNIDPEVDPTTNAVIKIQVISPVGDTDVLTYSDPFTLRGLKILSPNVGTNWVVGGSGTIKFLSAGMGGGALARLYYSADGVTYETNSPIAVDVAVSDGMNTVPWNIESSIAITREPSTNAHVMVVCGSYLAESKPFKMRGLKVTVPTSVDIWAVSDLTNIVQWVGADAAGPFDVTHTLWVDGVPSFTAPIGSGIAGFSAEWSMSSNSIGTNTIRVTDGTYTADSEYFLVVGNPAIKINTPAEGDFWKVAETHTIRWTMAGKVSNDFTILWSQAPFVNTNVMAVGSFPLNGSVYSHDWATPDTFELGKMRIIITNNLDPDVWDIFENFEIAAKFEIQPFVGDLYALESKTVNWTTRGQPNNGVDFYWSIDPLRRTNYWHLIDNPLDPDDAPFTAVSNGVPSMYSWVVANVKTNTVWLRVQDHNYASRVFDISRVGPYDDLGIFEVKYYKIFWEVYDLITSNRLDKLAVADSSGWSAANLSCVTNQFVVNTISHEYPFGIWNTEWYREFFHDKVVMYWESKNYALGAPPVWTQQVFMTRSEIEPDYHVLANFDYNATNKTFTIHSWLERSGRILDKPTKCTITVYDEAGNLTDTISDSDAQDTGVFWLTWDASALSAGLVYFAKVTIEYSGIEYSSGLTFALRVPLGDEILGLMEGMEGRLSNRVDRAENNITNAVGVVSTNLNEHERRQGLFRNSTTDALAAISNATASIGSMTNMFEGLASLSNILASADLNQLTNLSGFSVGIISNIQAAILQQAEDYGRMQARILTRPTMVKAGSTNAVLYKSKSGLAPTMTVTDPDNTVQIAAVPMTEIAGTGIYQEDVTFALSWPLGEYLIECRDDATTNAGHDSIVMMVVTEDYWTDKTALNVMGAQIAGIQVDVSNTYDVVRNLSFADDFSNVTTSVSNLEKLIGSSVMSNFAALGTNMAAIKSKTDTIEWTNVVETLNAVKLLNLSNVTDTLVPILARLESAVTNDAFSNLTIIATGIAAIQGKTDTVNWNDISMLTNSMAGMNWAQMTNEVNISLAGLSNGLYSVATNVTDIRSIVAGLDIEGITNTLVPMLEQLETLMTNSAMSSLTNIASLSVDLSYIKNNTVDMSSNLLSLISQSQTISNSLSQVYTEVSAVRTTVDAFNLHDITNTLVPMLRDLNVLVTNSAMAQITNVAALAGDIAGLRTVSDRLWTNAVAVSSNVNMMQTDVTDIRTMVTALDMAAITNTLVPMMRDLKTLMTNEVIANLTNIATMATDLGVIRTRTDGMDWQDVSNILDTVNSLGDLTNLTTLMQLQSLTSTVTKLETSLTKLTNLTEVATDVKTVINNVRTVQTDITRIRNVTDQVNWGDVSDIVSRAERLQKDMNEIDWQVVEDLKRTTSLTIEQLRSDLVRISKTTELIASISDSASDAAKQAKAAKSAASGAQSAIGQLETALGEGDENTIQSVLAVIKQSIEGLKGDLSGITTDVNFVPVIDELKRLEARINEFASKKDLEPLMAVNWDDFGKSGEVTKKNFTELNNRVEEMRAMMELVRQLSDKAANVPIVTDWYEAE